MEPRCPASPGPVEQAETVIRAIYSPDLFDRDTGKINPSAVKLDDLLRKKALWMFAGTLRGFQSSGLITLAA